MPDFNDPQLANATQASIVLEIAHTLELYKTRTQEPAYRLAKCILFNEQMP
jgi:hypothetical protein